MARVVAPSLNATVPVGVPVPVVDETKAVSVIGWQGPEADRKVREGSGVGWNSSAELRPAVPGVPSDPPTIATLVIPGMRSWVAVWLDRAVAIGLRAIQVPVDGS